MNQLSSIGSPWAWGGFVLGVLFFLALDLGVFHREARKVSYRDALTWSLVWVAMASLFAVGLYFTHGPKPALEFTTGYLIEKSLSVDNIFVFVVVFAAFRIPNVLQHRVLFWGILTALVLRVVMIFAGAAALQRFHWLIYIFGGFLILTGIKLVFSKEDAEGESLAMRLARRLIPSSKQLDGERFWTVENGRRVATPLLVTLVCIEFSDIIFALDSIPAIFAVTTDPFLVFTSNIFAILGLRSLFFLLADVMDRFVYLRFGLAAVLVFVGIKMVIVEFVKIPPALSLVVIAALLGTSITASWMATRKASKTAAQLADPNVTSG